MGTLLVPGLGRASTALGAVTPIPGADRKTLADAALEAARGAGESASTALGAVTPIPGADRKTLADAALEAARGAGATYADVRIGRYLNQFVITREDRVEDL